MHGRLRAKVEQFRQNSGKPSFGLDSHKLSWRKALETRSVNHGEIVVKLKEIEYERVDTCFQLSHPKFAILRVGLELKVKKSVG